MGDNTRIVHDDNYVLPDYRRDDGKPEYGGVVASELDVNNIGMLQKPPASPRSPKCDT